MPILPDHRADTLEKKSDGICLSRWGGVYTADDIMQGIELLTSTGVAVQPMKQFLQRVGSSEGLHSVEMEGLFKKVSNEVDPEDDGISFMNFRGLLMRMPDLLTNFDIFTT